VLFYLKYAALCVYLFSVILCELPEGGHVQVQVQVQGPTTVEVSVG
jgi:hypothetical protein